MSKKRWINLLVFSLPIWTGLISAAACKPIAKGLQLPILFQTDFGIAAFVFGGVVRNWGAFAFLLGFLRHLVPTFPYTTGICAVFVRRGP